MRVFWAAFAAVVLAISLAVHVSTFFGVDPMAAVPGVMLIHLLIFPPFLAAIYYLRQMRATKLSVPRWMKIAGAFLLCYAIISAVLFIILGEGGGPEQRDGKFFLTSHGTIIRELTRAEFLQQQAYVVRFFSTGWTLFSAIALGLLIAAPRSASGYGGATWDSSMVRESAQSASTLPVAQSSRVAGLTALCVYICCVAIILGGQPLLNLFCLPPIVTFAVIALRYRVQGFPHGPFDTTVGCLTIIPNFFLAIRWAGCLRQFAYVASYLGLSDAAYGHVQVIVTRTGPAHLSNGQPLHTQAWAALFILQFLLIVCGLVGLTFLGEQLGRLFRGLRSESPTKR